MPGIGLVLPRPGGVGIPVTLPFYDNFDRANNADELGNGWVAEGQNSGTKFGISGNKAYVSATTSFAYAVREYSTADVDMAFTQGGSTANEVGLLARYVNTQNFYYCRSNSGAGTASLSKRVNGSDTTLDTSDFLDTWAPGDVIRFRVSGSSLKVYVNGVEKLSATDTTHAGTKHGLFASDGARPASTASWDAFSAEVPS